ncbi:MAG TPA: ferredoxin reductase [Candidatus Saccharimonadales bacterium]|nr:ferredoxin reductase [Candidatus Saccharimonadales bacterium]
MVTTITAIRGASNDMTPMSSPGEPSEWFAATITHIVQETPTVKTFVFAMPHPVHHAAGQHYEIRLTAPDGYQAARLYSAASVATGKNHLELTVALMPNGEVSPYLHHTATTGTQVEIRGPLGKFFMWDPASTSPVLLISGGSGVVPMRCILQAHALAKSTTPIHLLYSARTYSEIIYKNELLRTHSLADHTTITVTDEKPLGWHGKTGRIDAALLQEMLDSLPPNPLCYICGATPFVEAMANTLVALGIPAEHIKAERFGATA